MPQWKFVKVVVGYFVVAMDRKNKKSKPNPLTDHPLNQLTRGDVLWDDDFVESMAKERSLPPLTGIRS